MFDIFLRVSVVESLEMFSVKSLLPMFHIHNACPLWIMTDDNIVPLIIIERRVTITYLSHEVSTNFSKLMAEEDTCISLEPPEGREELINVSEVIPLYKP